MKSGGGGGNSLQVRYEKWGEGRVQSLTTGGGGGGQSAYDGGGGGGQSAYDGGGAVAYDGMWLNLEQKHNMKTYSIKILTPICLL